MSNVYSKTFSGIYDQDAPEEILLAQPYLYRQGRLGRVYKPHSFWVTMADCLYQSLIVFFVARGVSALFHFFLCICEYTLEPDGIELSRVFLQAYNDSDVGLWQLGTTVTTSCMFIMLLQAAIEIRSWVNLIILLSDIKYYHTFFLPSLEKTDMLLQTVIHLGAILLSLAIYFAFTILYNSFELPYIGYSTSYGAVLKAFASPLHWAIVLLSVVAALLPR